MHYSKLKDFPQNFFGEHLPQHTKLKVPLMKMVKAHLSLTCMNTQVMLLISL